MPTKDDAKANESILHVPVTVSILVPIKLDMDLTHLTAVDEMAGCTVLDVMSDEEAAPGLIDHALSKATEDETVMDALQALLYAVNVFRQDNPTAKARYTPFMGVVPENDY